MLNLTKEKITEIMGNYNVGFRSSSLPNSMLNSAFIDRNNSTFGNMHWFEGARVLSGVSVEVAAAITKAHEDPLSIAFDQFVSREPAILQPSGSEFRFFTAACGTGKTRGMPMKIQQHLNKKKVLLLVPNVLAATGAFSHYSKIRKVWCRAGGLTKQTSSLEHADFIIMTNGAYVAAERKELMDLTDFVVFLDECHDETIETCKTYLKLIQKKTSIVAMSATGQHWPAPSLKTVDAYNVFFTNPVTRKAMQMAGQTKQQKEDYKAAIHTALGLVGFDMPRVYCILGHDIYNANYFNDFLEMKEDIKIELSSKGMKWYKDGIWDKTPDPDVELLAKLIKENDTKRIAIIATPVIEVGVTLPEVEMIFDLGTRLHVHIDRNSFLEPSFTLHSLVKPVVKPAKLFNVIQGMGRVSRTKPGLSITFNSNRPDWEYVPWDIAIAENACCVEMGMNRMHDVEEPVVTDAQRKSIDDLEAKVTSPDFEHEDYELIRNNVNAFKNIIRNLDVLKANPAKGVPTLPFRTVMRQYANFQKVIKTHFPRPESFSLGGLKFSGEEEEAKESLKTSDLEAKARAKVNVTRGVSRGSRGLRRGLPPTRLGPPRTVLKNPVIAKPAQKDEKPSSSSETSSETETSSEESSSSEEQAASDPIIFSDDAASLGSQRRASFEGHTKEQIAKLEDEFLNNDLETAIQNSLQDAVPNRPVTPDPPKPAFDDSHVPASTVDTFRTVPEEARSINDNDDDRVSSISTYVPRRRKVKPQTTKANIFSRFLSFIWRQIKRFGGWIKSWFVKT